LLRHHPCHIGALAELAADLKPCPGPSGCRSTRTKRPQLSYEPCAASIYGVTPYHQDNSFLIIGERLNASGSKKGS
jgi:5-methyltetrahydrofolate--homocysteine methyltransferase